MEKATPEDIAAILHLHKDVLPDPDKYDLSFFRVPIMHFSSFNDNGRQIRVEFFKRVRYIDTLDNTKYCWAPVMDFNF